MERHGKASSQSATQRRAPRCCRAGRTLGRRPVEGLRAATDSGLGSNGAEGKRRVTATGRCRGAGASPRPRTCRPARRCHRHGGRRTGIDRGPLGATGSAGCARHERACAARTGARRERRAADDRTGRSQPVRSRTGACTVRDGSRAGTAGTRGARAQDGRGGPTGRPPQWRAGAGRTGPAAAGHRRNAVRLREGRADGSRSRPTFRGTRGSGTTESGPARAVQRTPAAGRHAGQPCTR